MKKRIRFLASLLCLVMIFSAAVSAAPAQKVKYTSSEKDSHAFIKGFYQQPKNSLDVVLLGSSAIYRYFMPPQAFKQSGFTSYMYASSVQSFEASELIIQEILKTQKPDLFVIEMRSLVRAIRAVAFNNNQSWKKGSSKYNSWLVDSVKSDSMRKKIAEELFGKNYKKIYNEGKASYKTWKTPKKFLTDTHYETYKSIIDLKSACPASGHAVIKASDLSGYQETMELPSFAKKQINELAAYIKKKGIKVLFVSTPYKEVNQSKLIENSIGAYLAQKGLTYINANDIYGEIGIDFSQDFYNSKHTNVLGAKKFTKYLSKYITSNYQIKTNHNAKITSQWNKAYLDWYELSKQKSAQVREKMKG